MTSTNDKSSMPELQWATVNETLYERQEQKELLLRAVQKCCRSSSASSRHPELCLLSGGSGTGKTSLAIKHLAPYVQKDLGGFFLRGKFGRLESSEKYNAVVSAFSGFFSAAKQGRLPAWPSLEPKVRECLKNEPFLTELIPELEDYGEVAVNASSPSGGAWIDSLQLDLIVALVKDCAIEGFAVVGACQTEEMSPEHHLAVRLREMESDSVLVTDVMMGDLDMAGLTDLLAALLKTKPAAVVDLARIVKQITGGNPFFTLHLLRTMYEKELVSLALDTGEWTWETFEVICRTTHCDTVRSLLLVQIKSLPPEILAVLTTAAVLGEEIDELLLKEVCRDHEVHEALDYVADRDLLVRHEQSNVWRFAHNQVRQSLYDMILESDHEKFHLDIGKHLLSNLDEQGLKKHCGFVVNEIRLGAGLLLHEEEREQISLFCLHSGEQAALSSRFTTAASHFEFGIELLSNRHWRDQYSLSLSLYNAAAEVEYCCADFLRVHKLIDEVKCNARNEDDKIRVRTLSIYSYGSQNMITLAFDSGLDLLSDLGVSFPKKPSLLRVLVESYKTKRLLRKMTDRGILSLPPLQSRQATVLGVINMMTSYSLMATGRELFAPLLAMRSIQVTLTEGMCGASSVGLAFLGVLNCTLFGDIGLGTRLGRLSLKMLDSTNSTVWACRVNVLVRAFLLPSTEPLQAQLKALRMAHRYGRISGDIEYAMLAASMHTAVALHSAVPLPQMMENSRLFLTVMEAYNQGPSRLFLLPNMQFASNMMGENDDALTLTGEFMSETHMRGLARSTKNNSLENVLLLVKLLLCCYLGDFEVAERVSKELNKSPTKGSITAFAWAAAQMYSGVASAALCATKKTRTRLSNAARCLRSLKSYARDGPYNYQHMVYLVEAEIMVAKGEIGVRTMRKYEAAIERAEASKLWHEMGLACERAALAVDYSLAASGDLHTSSQSPAAANFLERGIVAYQRWGATIKVRQLQDRLGVGTALSNVKPVEMTTTRIISGGSTSAITSDDMSVLTDPLAQSMIVLIDPA